MAGRKRKPDSPNPDAFIVSDNDIDDSSTGPPPTRTSKRVKQTTTSPPTTSTTPGQSRRDAENNIYWEISRARRVTVSDYRGKKMIHLREYYEKDGNQLPGKKGISLTLEQYNAFLGVVPAIEKELVRAGVEEEHVVRVVYEEGTVGGEDGVEDVKQEEQEEENGDGEGEGQGGGEDASDDGGGGRASSNGNKKGRKNHEATSEEEDE